MQETASAGGRGAGGWETGGGSVREVWLDSGYARMVGLQAEGREFRLRVGPLGGGDSAATVTLAATGVLDNKPSRV
ncbi:MAG: hypothetical protein WCA49_13500 [Candidatus Sulfotelmatobacter sp.]